ncbi:MAG TPA: hypothetical protein VHK01_01330, partial [Lacipirellulaceae bacterium]|nr:hypothetical protein [Lacipirellulaceae bacterium]
MIQLVQQWVSLLAASSNGQVWGRFDHQRPAYDSEQLLMIVTLAVVAVTIGLLLVRLRSNFQTDSWRALFSELCR